MSFDPRKSTIYLDMDNVLADFDLHIRAVWPHKKFIDGKYQDSELWELLGREHQDLFSILKPTSNCFKLFCTARLTANNVELLTVLPWGANFPYAEQHKREWARRHLGDVKVNVCGKPSEKRKWAEAGHILVDDRRDNIADWIEAGGIGIHHDYSTPEKSIRALDKLILTRKVG